ncbi:hypothetical protein F5Y17DRAFT_265480 [Xylariaceae sp. FL0594]|nr:hypothetical protein F5Y17DRAFT_265480 [Xylariaceae sp. FL0594]
MASVDDPPHTIRDASVPQTRSGARARARSRSGLKSRSRSRSKPRSHPTLPMTPPDTDGDTELAKEPHGVLSRNLDYIVHKLNRKPMLQDTVRWHLLREEELPIQATEPLAPFRQIPVPVQSAELGPVTEPTSGLSTRCDYNSSMQGIPIPPARMQSDSQAHDLPAEDKRLPDPSDSKRSRRGTESRLHKSASNLRMLGLVTDMIENGIQCQLQSSRPPSPTKTPAVPPLPAYNRSGGTGYTLDPEIVPSRLELEVDMDLGAVDEESPLGEALALREASSPAGIHKFGILRYRSSSEAAHSCKNMRKSVPRMRRRRRTNPVPATGPSVQTPPAAI